MNGSGCLIQLDPNPFFRKIIVPWYDAKPLCVAVIVLNVFVVLFGITGIGVARENPAYSGAIWVPALLVAMGSYVIVSVSIRLIKRYRKRSSRWTI